MIMYVYMCSLSLYVYIYNYIYKSRQIIWVCLGSSPFCSVLNVSEHLTAVQTFRFGGRGLGCWGDVVRLRCADVNRFLFGIVLHFV